MINVLNGMFFNDAKVERRKNRKSDFCHILT